MKNAFCDVLFPTFVVYTENKELITENILNESRKLIEKYGNIPFHSPCISTVKTFGDVLNLPEFEEIKHAIINTLSAYIQKTRIVKDNLKFSGSWLNLYNKHGYQDLHLHSDSMLSGGFYLKSDGNKDLIFQSPYHFFQANTPDFEEMTSDNCSNVEYTSNAGRCFIFPSHLMHKTLPATSERISLSFNIVYERK